MRPPLAATSVGQLWQPAIYPPSAHVDHRHISATAAHQSEDATNEMTTDSRRLIANAIAMAILGILQRSIGLVSITILARILEPRGLGAFAFTQSSAQTFYAVSRLGADFGLHVGLAKLSFPDDRERAEALLGEALTVFLVIACGVGTVMALLARPIARELFGAPELSMFVVAGAVFFVGQTMSQYCYTAYAGLHSFRTYSRTAAATSLLSVALITSGGLIFGPLGAAYGLGAGQALTVVLLTVGLRTELKQRGIRLAPRWPASEAISLLSLGLPFYVGGLVVIPAEFASLGFLTRSAGVEALGELRVTQALMSAASIIPVSLAAPMVSYLAQGMRHQSGLNAILTQLKAIWVMALAIAIVLAAIWPVAIELVFGGAFQVALSTGVLALAAFVPNMLLIVLAGALLATGSASALFFVGALQGGALALTAWILIGRYGLGGFLAAQAVASSAAAALAGGALVLKFGPSMLRGWMLTLAGLTLAGVILVAADITVKETLAVRTGVTILSLALLVAVGLSFVATPDERKALAAIWLRGLTRLTTRGGPSQDIK